MSTQFLPMPVCLGAYRIAGFGHQIFHVQKGLFFGHHWT